MNGGSGAYPNVSSLITASSFPIVLLPSHELSSLYPIADSSSATGVKKPDPADVFPSTPYVTVSDLFMNSDIQQVVLPKPTPEHDCHTLIIGSSKLSHYRYAHEIELSSSPSSIHKNLNIQTYETVNRFNGKRVLIRRLVNCPTTSEHCLQVFERLKYFRHPNLVQLYMITQTNEFVIGSNDVIMDYRFIPGAVNLSELLAKHEGIPFNEGFLWSLACQMIGLLQLFHENGIPLRGLALSKVLYVPVSCRFYYSGLGLIDIVEPINISTAADIHIQQDIKSLGRVLLRLTLGSQGNESSALEGLEKMTSYSPSFHHFVRTCCEGAVDHLQLCTLLGSRLSLEVSNQAGSADIFLNECAKEVHNGRMMRLAIKLNFVLESAPETEHQQTNLFILRLFSQYVFHQVDENNNVRLDWGHAFHSLNKLECGSSDVIQIVGPSETILVISFKEVQQILELEFQNLQSDSEKQTLLMHNALPRSTL